MIVALLLVFFNNEKQEGNAAQTNHPVQHLTFKNMDGYYLGFTQLPDQPETKELVFLHMKKFYPNNSETPQATITYQAINDEVTNNASYETIIKCINNKEPDNLLEELSIFGQGPVYWSSIKNLSDENKSAAALIFSNTKNENMRVVISYRGSEHPELNSFSLVKIDGNKLNTVGITNIKNYLLDPQHNEEKLLNYFRIIEYGKALNMVDDQSGLYIGSTASQIIE